MYLINRSGASGADMVSYLASKLRMDSQVFQAKQDKRSGERLTREVPN